jgi:hypothetical protein
MSCLFDSLSYFVKENSFQIRNIICDYLEANNNIIEGLDTNFILSLDMPKDNYISNMRMPSSWGGGIEIQSACNIWNLRILIHNRRSITTTIIEFLPISKNYDKTIQLSWTGNHFEPLNL